nr:hypothetical protein [Tanacetum cinerariifolium]
MTGLADKAIMSGADNRPPMLEKDTYDSWKSIMELYMLNRQHGRMILESVENGPLLWLTVEENGVTRPKKYSKLSATEAIQADCDVKATYIILQGLPPEVYALVSTHKVTKELWERIQMLMQGTSLTKQERECKLYDEFDKFAYKKGESLRDFYLRFSRLLNDMNIYNMKLEQFQVNTKFLNTLPPEWSKFVTDVKLVRDLHTTNVDHLHAYWGQHEYHANKIRLMHERTSDPLALVHRGAEQGWVGFGGKVGYGLLFGWLGFKGLAGLVLGVYNSLYLWFRLLRFGKLAEKYTSQAQSSTPLSITYPSNDFQTFVNHNVYNLSTSIPQVEYAPALHQQSDFSQPDTGLVVLVFQKGNDPIDAINHMMSFLTVIALMANLSHYGSDNLAELEPKLYDGSVIQKTDAIVIRHSEETLMLEDEKCSKMLQKQKDPMMSEKKVNTKPKEESCNIDRELALEKQVKELNNIVFKRNQSAQTIHMLTKPQFFYDHSTRKALVFQNPCYLKKNQQLEPKLYDGSVIQKTDAIVIRHSEETLMLEDESRSKMLQKQKDPMMSEKKVNTKPVDYAALNQLSKDFKTRFIPQTELSAEQAF